MLKCRSHDSKYSGMNQTSVCKCNRTMIDQNVKHHNRNHQGRALAASAATVHESVMQVWNEREAEEDGHARGHDMQEKV